MLKFFEKIVAFFLAFLSFLGFHVRPEYKNVVYDKTSERQVMDIYYPDMPDKIEGKVNVFIMVHGGGWTLGDKGSYKELCKTMAKKGMVAVTMNYRLFQTGIPDNEQSVFIPDVLDDLDNAIKAVDKRLRDEGITPNKLILQGHSAGASTVVYYGATRQNESAIPLAFVVNMASPMNYGPTYGINPTHVANPSLPHAFLSNAITDYVDSTLPPQIMFYGDYDGLTSIAQVEEYCAMLENAGVKHDFFRFPNTDHMLKTQKTDHDVEIKAYEKFDEYVKLYAAIN